MKLALLVFLLSVPTLGYAQVRSHRFLFIFNDNSVNEDGFGVLERGPGEANFHELMRLGENVTQFSVDVVGLRGDQFCYSVYAFNASGNSGPSNVLCGRIPKGKGNPK